MIDSHDPARAKSVRRAARRPRVLPPSHIYPVDEWNLLEQRYAPEFLEHAETLFATSNGYLGLRGTFEEGEPTIQGGTFVNGFFEAHPIVYGERAYGFAETGQTIVNVTNGAVIKLYVDDEPFELETANLLRFRRTLDLRAGSLDRELTWELPSGKRVGLKSRRLVSFEHRHLAVISYEVTVHDADAQVVIASEMLEPRSRSANGGDPRLARGQEGGVLAPLSSVAVGRRVVLCHTTRRSGMRLACGMDHALATSCPTVATCECNENEGKVVFSVDARADEPIALTKFISYHTSATASSDELCDRVGRTLDRALRDGSGALFAGQARYLSNFWRRSDVRIEGEPAVQQAARWNLFQLCQATGRVEGHGVPAKGLTGQGYEGHYFWDTEIFVLPFLIFAAPHIAKSVLQFRYGLLDKARLRARQMNQRGALFPWRTIDGDEASAYFAGGTAQYHINADVMYALRKYTEVTGDESFLNDRGAEMLVETARLWVDLGCYPPHAHGAFCINGVTGPDEYTALVDNNRYTNLMARENLRFAFRTIELLRDTRPLDFAALVRKTGFDLGELAEWKQAADHMYLPLDEESGVQPQDDTFLTKEAWDFENTPAENYPLLLHYHPLVLYRSQVIKQADVVLAMVLLGKEFSLEVKRRNFDYYDPLTTGDSSLSACAQSILASEVGYADRAYTYFMDAVVMDLADVGGNVKDGCHIASLGGTWMALVYGFGGLRDYAGHLSFDPRLPAQWTRLRFPLRVQASELEVDILPESVTYTLRNGVELEIRHRGQRIRLTAAAPTSVQPNTNTRRAS